MGVRAGVRFLVRYAVLCCSWSGGDDDDDGDGDDARGG
jgi:hypothetical protein